MCTVCGCGEDQQHLESHQHGDSHAHHTHAHTHEGHTHSHAPDGHGHSHTGSDAHDHVHAHDGTAHYGLGPAQAHVPGMSQSRMLEIETNILSKNNAYAEANRRWLNDHRVLALNLVSSPGSGKTTLLARTISELGAGIDVAVIEGDQQTSNDAERIRETGARALQINTGKGCHLDAHMVGHAIESLAAADDSLLFIENVGNLVCPASFDLGERHKVVILSVTEGEDKPLKYPDMFAAADLVLINKVDLLPYLDFDIATCIDNARRVNPDIAVIEVSATSGAGMAEWRAWIESARRSGAVAA